MSDAIPTATKPPRERALDVLRGLAIAAMILVNAADSEVTPAWLKHAPPGTNGMTFADAVFPAFIVAMGMSVPLALSRALARGTSRREVFLDVLRRTASLLVMGVFMVAREDNTVGGEQIWTGLMFLAFFATWLEVPRRDSPRRRWFIAANVIGLALLLALAGTYRGPAGELLVFDPLIHPDATVWVRHGWWGILGSLGWVYLVVASLYLLFGGRPLAMLVAIPLTLGLYALETAGLLDPSPADAPFRLVDPLLWIHGHVSFGHQLGVFAAMGLFGGVLGTMMVRPKGKERLVPTAIALTVAALVAALALFPVYGVSKHGGTPSWALFSVAITIALWLGLRYAVDGKGWTRGLGAIEEAGKSPLTAYVLHPLVQGPLVYAAFRIGIVPEVSAAAAAWLVPLGAVLMTVFIIHATGWLARHRVRLRV
ncbi:MAG: DUF5009 domain-containing protein [Myxococcales bacterium]|nr:DUF5009 domain-containing protein [Myxococcales bacterium]